MRRDTQIGIILGIVILVIIGVFLSTRTSDLKTVLPDLVISEEGRQKSEIEDIKIDELIAESKKTESEKSVFNPFDLRAVFQITTDTDSVKSASWPVIGKFLL